MKARFAPAPPMPEVKVALALAGALFALMALAGLAMLAAQGRLVAVAPALFYQLLTAHGAGMMAAAGLAGGCILWHFTGRHLLLPPVVFRLFLGLFVSGALLMAGAMVRGGVAPGWTALFPLPARSGGSWSDAAALTFLVGYAALAAGFLVLHIGVGRGLARTYGGLGRAMGWHVGFERAATLSAPPPAIIAATVTVIVGAAGAAAGIGALIAGIAGILAPGHMPDALLVRNMTALFAHASGAGIIAAALIAVYEIVPPRTGRVWQSSRTLVLAWSAMLLAALVGYPAHMLEDTAMPVWMLISGQIFATLGPLPLVVVTASALIGQVRGAGPRRDIALSLSVLGVAGWSLATVPATFGAVIAFNRVTHNTLWEAGATHLLMLGGVASIILGYAASLRRGGAQALGAPVERTALAAFAFGGVGFAVMFLVSGAGSVPARWAAHVSGWVVSDRITTAFAALAVLGALVLLARLSRAWQGTLRVVGRLRARLMPRARHLLRAVRALPALCGQGARHLIGLMRTVWVPRVVRVLRGLRLPRALRLPGTLRRLPGTLRRLPRALRVPGTLRLPRALRVLLGRRERP